MSSGRNWPTILAAGLSPAWQQILAFDAFQVGEVNRAREAHACASGKVLNVGLALHTLGANARTLSLIGGPTGEQIEGEFAAWGALRRWIRAESPTRTCTTVVDYGACSVTELVENARAVSISELEQFAIAYREEAAMAGIVVLSGSLPSGAPPSLYHGMIANTPGRVILDAQGPPLLEALPARPFLIKPNRQELGRTLGRDLTNDRDLHEAMQELHRAGAQWVVVTHGKQAVWASGPDGLFRAQPVRIDRAINPIGSGDCLAAGLAWRLAEGDSVPEALRWGIVAAADNSGQLVPARLDRTRISKLHAAVMVEQL